MSFEVKYTARARQDLRNIYEYPIETPREQRLQARPPVPSSISFRSREVTGGGTSPAGDMCCTRTVKTMPALRARPLRSYVSAALFSERERARRQHTSQADLRRTSLIPPAPRASPSLFSHTPDVSYTARSPRAVPARTSSYASLHGECTVRPPPRPGHRRR